jgi:translocator protein
MTNAPPPTPQAPPRRDWLVLTAFILAAFGASAIGSLTGTGTTDWYRTIAKPDWTPPGWLFGPVWTVLYFSIGVSGWLVWRKSGFRAARIAMAIFAVQLILNATWSPVFFGLQRPDIALAVIIGLWLSIGAMIAAFRPHDRRAAWMLVPYLLWVSFATALNFAIMRLNP